MAKVFSTKELRRYVEQISSSTFINPLKYKGHSHRSQPFVSGISALHHAQVKMLVSASGRQVRWPIKGGSVTREQSDRHLACP